MSAKLPPGSRVPRAQKKNRPKKKGEGGDEHAILPQALGGKEKGEKKKKRKEKKKGGRSSGNSSKRCPALLIPFSWKGEKNRSGGRGKNKRKKKKRTPGDVPKALEKEKGEGKASGKKEKYGGGGGNIASHFQKKGDNSEKLQRPTFSLKGKGKKTRKKRKKGIKRGKKEAEILLSFIIA